MISVTSSRHSGHVWQELRMGLDSPWSHGADKDGNADNPRVGLIPRVNSSTANTWQGWQVGTSRRDRNRGDLRGPGAAKPSVSDKFGEHRRTTLMQRGGDASPCAGQWEQGTTHAVQGPAELPAGTATGDTRQNHPAAALECGVGSRQRQAGGALRSSVRPRMTARLELD